MIPLLHYPTPVDILLVEDNPGDIELTKQAFESGRIANHLYTVRDGEEALDYLYRRAPFTDAVRPDVILLDLNMPRKNGKEVIAAIREDAALKNIPVVVLSSSFSELDIVRSYNLTVNAYIIKPVDAEQFLRAIETVDNFWLSVVKLPQQRTQVA